MIDEKHYILLEERGYVNKTLAYNEIEMWYSHLSGVTTYYSEGLWYIVRSRF